MKKVCLFFGCRDDIEFSHWFLVDGWPGRKGQPFSGLSGLFMVRQW